MENKSNKLALLSLGINAVLLVLVIILFTKVGSGSNDEVSSTPACDTCETTLPPDDGKLTIAWFNTDSLNNNLLFVSELEDLMLKSQQKAEKKLMDYQKGLDSWQRGWQERGTLLPSEQERYMKEAEAKQQEAVRFEQDVQMQLAMEQEEYMMTHIMRITKFSKQYAQENGYDMVFSFQLGQNLVYADPRMNITQPLIKLINDDYKSMNETDAANNSEEDEDEENGAED